MNCTNLDDSARAIENFIVSNDFGFVIFITILLTTSCVLLSHGERFVKSFGTLVGGVGGCVAFYVLSHVFHLDM